MLSLFRCDVAINTDDLVQEVEEDARREVIMQQRASLHAMRT